MAPAQDKFNLNRKASLSTDSQEGFGNELQILSTFNKLQKKICLDENDQKMLSKIFDQESKTNFEENVLSSTDIEKSSF